MSVWDIKCPNEGNVKQSSQFKLMLPVDLKDWLAREAAKNMRTLSKEIIFLLTEKMEAATEVGVGNHTSAAAHDHTALAGG